MERISRDVTRGRQSLLYLATYRVGVHVLRVRRIRNAYDFQSFALILRWVGDEWRELASIPYREMATCDDDSYASRAPRPNRSELRDEAELLRRAAAILGINMDRPERSTKRLTDADGNMTRGDLVERLAGLADDDPVIVVDADGNEHPIVDAVVCGGGAAPVHGAIVTE